VLLSPKVRYLLKEALEIQEDIALSEIVEERKQSWGYANRLTHDAVGS
jgi:hypothetical protein